MIYIKIDQQILPENEALISVKQRACRFGDGVFESCKVISGIIYNFEAHLQRLQNGLTAIKINYDISDLKKSAYQLIQKNNLIQGTIRIAISRGIGSKGYLPYSNIKPLLIIETDSTPAQIIKPVDLWLTELKKTPIATLPINYKLSQGLNSTLAMLEAQENNCFDSLLLNEQGQICETGCANIFWIKDDVLYMPSPECGLLLGTIRAKIIALSPLKIKAVAAKLSELFTAQEAFITNSRIGVVAINKILPGNIAFGTWHYSDLFNNLLNLDIETYVQKEKSCLV